MTPEDRPLLQLLRSDCIIKLYRDGDSNDRPTVGRVSVGRPDKYTLRVARLRGTRTTLENLTAEEALDKLAEEMKSDG